MDMMRWACMEEMRAASYAYYENLTDHQKQLVSNFYTALDTDGNGMVSLRECWDFLSEEGYTSHLPPDLLQLLDNNGNGILDFYECITLLYMIKSMRLVKCSACGVYLWGMHFLCVQCYEVGSRTYDLCCSCYRKKSFRHEHGFFLDNYALLRKKWMAANPSPPPPPRTQEKTRGVANTWRVAQNNRPSSKREKLKEALLLLDLAMGVTTTAVVGASLVSTSCSIM